MIVTETVTINGKKYKHNYSDAGFYIERDGVQYADAIDPLDSGRVYTEGEEMELPDEEAIDTNV